jgi:hypothetical protein
MQPRLFETVVRKALDGRRKQILDHVNGRQSKRRIASASGAPIVIAGANQTWVKSVTAS